MAQDGGDLVERQPTSVHGSPPRALPILQPPGWCNRRLRMLRSATGEEAKPNEYVDTNSDRLNGRNNNESPNSRSGENSGDEINEQSRTDLKVITDSTGKTRVIKVVKSKPDTKVYEKVKSEQITTATTTHTELHGNSDEKLSKNPFPCPQCGYCRCEKCRKSNILPGASCCNGRCECSPECFLDYCTCMCCMKSLFYHCASESDRDYAYCTDDPCSCRPHRRCARWTCMSLLTLVLPCLCCYLPGRGALEACRQCYSQGRQGCQCSRWESGEAYGAL